MKKFLICVVAVMALASPVFASLSRIDGLGIDNWMITEDDNLIWMNPARVSDYTGMIWGEWPPAGPGSAWGGMSKELMLGGLSGALFVGQGYQGVLGGAGRNAGGSDVAAIVNSPLSTTSMAALNPVGRFDLFIGAPMDTMKIGGMLNVAMNSQSQENKDRNDPEEPGDIEQEDEFKSSDMEATAGVVLEDIGPISQLDAVASVDLIKVENSFSSTTYLVSGGDIIPRITDEWNFELDNGINFSILGRALIPKDDYDLIGYLNYEKQDISSKFTRKEDANADGDYEDVGNDINLVQTREDTANIIEAGLAMNKMVGLETKLISAISIRNTKDVRNAKTEQKFSARTGVSEEYNWERTQTQIPVNIALEHNFSDVVATRLGIEKNIINSQKDTTNDPDYDWDADEEKYDLINEIDDEDLDDNAAGAATVTWGMGIKPLEYLVIDTVVSQQLLYTGGFLPSGVAGALSTQVTATIMY